MVGGGDNTNKLSVGILVLFWVILNGFRAFKNTFFMNFCWLGGYIKFWKQGFSTFTF